MHPVISHLDTSHPGVTAVVDQVLCRVNHLALHAFGAMSEAPANLPGAGDPSNTGPDFGKASPFGLLIIVLLLLGTFGLVWSMNRQLKKVPDSFDPEHPGPDQAADPGGVKEPTLDENSDRPSESSD